MRKIILLFIMCAFSSILQANTTEMQEEEIEGWMEQYLSVSFPLKNITVNSPIGKRHDPFTGTWKQHNGIDLKARYEEVMSMFDGKILKVGGDRTSGKYIVLQHGNYTISYCHMSKIFVYAGQEITAGDFVGVSGNTGRSTGPHLHITARYDGQLINPYTLLIYIRETRESALAHLGIGVENMDYDREEDFFTTFAPVAIDHQQKYGIPSSVTLSQMALESQFGQSKLAREANNYFGIKATKYWLENGKPYYVIDDDRPKEKFCAYPTVIASMESHARILTGDLYKRCHRFSETDYHNWLVGIKASGYATNAKYVSSCEKIIRKYKLYLYDILAKEETENSDTLAQSEY